MKSLRFVCIGLLFFVCFAVSGCEQEDITPQFKPSMQFSKELHIVSDIVLPAMGGLARHADHKDTTVQFDFLVKEVNDQGVADIEVTISKIKASMKSLSIGASFDSEKRNQQEISEKDNKKAKPRKGKSQSRKEKYRRNFAAIVGAKFLARVDKHGAVLELMDIDPAIKRYMSGTTHGNFGEDQLWLLLAESSLRNVVGPSALDAIESIKPRKGTTWVGYHDHVVPRSKPVRACNTYKIEDITEKNGEQIIVVSYRMLVSKRDSDETGAKHARKRARRSSGGFDIVSAGGPGELEFLVKRGMILKQHEVIRAEIQTAGSARKANKKSGMFYDVERTVRLID